MYTHAYANEILFVQAFMLFCCCCCCCCCCTCRSLSLSRVSERLRLFKFQLLLLFSPLPLLATHQHGQLAATLHIHTNTYKVTLYVLNVCYRMASVISLSLSLSRARLLAHSHLHPSQHHHLAISNYLTRCLPSSLARSSTLSRLRSPFLFRLVHLNLSIQLVDRRFIRVYTYTAYITYIYIYMRKEMTMRDCLQLLQT